MAKKVKVEELQFGKPTLRDFEVVKKPRITEKSMELMQNENKITVEVLPTSNKTEIKLAFQRLFNVKVEDVKIINTLAKATRRGGRHSGHIPGFKKAIVSVAEGQAIDLFKE